MDWRKINQHHVSTEHDIQKIIDTQVDSIKKDKIVEFIPLTIEKVTDQLKIRISKRVTDALGEPVPTQYISHSAAYTARSLLSNLIARKLPAQWKNGQPVPTQHLPFTRIELKIEDIDVNIGFGKEVKRYHPALEAEAIKATELQKSQQSPKKQRESLQIFKSELFEKSEKTIELIPLIYDSTNHLKLYADIVKGFKDLAKIKEAEQQLSKIISYFLETAKLDFAVAPKFAETLSKTDKAKLKENLSQLFAITQISEEARTGGTGLIFETAIKALTEKKKGEIEIGSKAWGLFDILNKDTFAFLGARGSTTPPTSYLPASASKEAKEEADTLIKELQEKVKIQNTGFWGSRRWKFELGISPSDRTSSTRRLSAQFNERIETPNRGDVEPPLKRGRQDQLIASHNR